MYVLGNNISIYYSRTSSIRWLFGSIQKWLSWGRCCNEGIYIKISNNRSRSYNWLKKVPSVWFIIWGSHQILRFYSTICTLTIYKLSHVCASAFIKWYGANFHFLLIHVYKNKCLSSTFFNCLSKKIAVFWFQQLLIVIKIEQFFWHIEKTLIRHFKNIVRLFRLHKRNCYK